MGSAPSTSKTIEVNQQALPILSEPVNNYYPPIQQHTEQFPSLDKLQVDLSSFLSQPSKPNSKIEQITSDRSQYKSDKVYTYVPPSHKEVPAHVKFLWGSKLQSRASFLLLLEFLNIDHEEYVYFITQLKPATGSLSFYLYYIKSSQQFSAKTAYRKTELLQIDQHYEIQPIGWQPSLNQLKSITIRNLMKSFFLEQIEYFGDAGASNLYRLTFVFTENVRSPPLSSYTKEPNEVRQIPYFDSIDLSSIKFRRGKKGVLSSMEIIQRDGATVMEVRAKGSDPSKDGKSYALNIEKKEKIVAANMTVYNYSTISVQFLLINHARLSKME